MDDSTPTLLNALRAAGVTFAPGLTDSEVARTEARYGFRFPSDLRDVLQAALPVGGGFPDWRNAEHAALVKWLDSPLQGILFDVENGVWFGQWGERPARLEDAERLVTELVAAAPKLIPIHGHRMMPDEPSTPGNPVYSVHQTDIIYYGSTLAEYVDNDFGERQYRIASHPRSIRFWRDFAE